jgi:hypothetical protein
LREDRASPREEHTKPVQVRPDDHGERSRA